MILLKSYNFKLVFFSAFIFFVLWLLLIFNHFFYGQECKNCHQEILQKLGRSIHSDLDCESCHTNIKTVTINQTKGEPVHTDVGTLGCADCHSKVEKEYLKSIHGRTRERNVSEAPKCHSCHGTHDILPSKDPLSKTHFKNISKTCGRCHSDEALITKYNIPFPDVIKSYENSVHSKAIFKGKRAAECADCHGVHNIQPSWFPDSKLYKPNIVSVCGKCHKEVASLYEESVHGQSLKAKKSMDAPACIDCHGEHLIHSVKDSNANVYSTEIPKTTCKQCHGLERLNVKYGIKKEVVKAYESNYHGLASRLGRISISNCESCHGYHNVFSPSDPRSTVHQDNIPITCGKCHKGTTRDFTLIKIHSTKAEGTEHFIVIFVQRFYIVLIFFTLIFMCLHNLLTVRRNILERTHQSLTKYAENPLRFSLVMRIQHLILMISFMILAYTGFSLSYPDSLFSYPFRMLSNGTQIRRTLHRISAIILILEGVFHLWWLFYTKEGKKELKEIIPTSADFIYFFKNIKYLISGKDKPHYEGKYEYPEKIEYWASAWGTIIMSVTGLIMWFINWSLSVFSIVIIDIARVIHFYEAILAILSILIWHFYWVIFHPEIYPMNFVWITGRKYLTTTIEKIKNNKRN